MASRTTSEVAAATGTPQFRPVPWRGVERDTNALEAGADGFSWWDETQRGNSSVMGVPGNPVLQQPFHDVLNGPLAPNLVDRPIVH